MTRRILLTALVAVLSTSSAALAAWNAKGTHEPNTSFDVTGGYMFLSPDTSRGATGHQVYFSTFVTQNADPHFDHGLSSLNPNVATLQTGHQAWMGMFTSLLGVWKDCNNDGYVGLGDNALWEYRTTLLDASFGESICPGIAPPNPIPLNWTPVHNDGTWVHEFIPIGPDAMDINNCHPATSNCDQNKWDIGDDDARVWVDWGKPGDPAAPNRCYVFAPQGPDPSNHPEWGTFQSTGGMLAFTDCWDDYFVTNTIDTVATGPLSPFSFSDHPRDQWNSSSILNRPNPWGDPRADSYVVAFDCSKPVATENAPEVGKVGLYTPIVPPRVDANGQFAGTVNETAYDVTTCNRGNNPNSPGNQDALANGPYAADKGGVVFQPGYRIQTDFPMQYDEGNRPAATAAAVGPSGPKDGGLSVAGDADGFWIATVTVSEDHNPFINRASVTSAGSEIQPVQYSTAYAYVGAAAVSSRSLVMNPTGKVGTYGSEVCGSASSGIIGGWDCNAAEWWPGWECNTSNGYTCSGVILGNNAADITVRIGQPYQLRDVNCYDNSFQASEGGANVGRNTSVNGIDPTSTAGVGPGVSYGLLTKTYCQ